MNIAIHHPGRVRACVESWSGYVQADRSRSIFGHRPALLARNTPLHTLAAAAPALRRAHSFFWLYSGTDDRFLPQNRAFAPQLARRGIPHRFRIVHGGHNWALWRGNAAVSYLAASRHLRCGVSSPSRRSWSRALLAATGWLYVVRAGGLPGPRVREALPLDELAKHSSSPLLLFVAVWVAAGAARRSRPAGPASSARRRCSSRARHGARRLRRDRASRSRSPGRSRRATPSRGRAPGAVYLPARSWRSSVALIARPARARAGARPRSSRWSSPPRRASSSSTRSCPASDEGLLRSLTPDAVGPARARRLRFAGLALLFAARGLARRRRRAWQLAVAWRRSRPRSTSCTALNHGTPVSAAVLILLVARRQDFPLPGDEQTRFLIARRARDRAGRDRRLRLRRTLAEPARRRPAVHAPVRRPRDRRRPARAPRCAARRTSAGAFGDWFPLCVFLLGVGATVWIVSGWLAPWRHRVRQEQRERERVEALVREWGVDTLAPFTLRQDKSYFLDDEGHAFLAYRVVGGVAIVSGDPVGRARAFDEPRRPLPRARPRAATGASRSSARPSAGSSCTARAGCTCSTTATRRSSTRRLRSRGPGDPEGAAVRAAGSSAPATRRRCCGRATSTCQLRVELESIADGWRGGQPERGFVMALDGLFSLGDDDAIFVIGRDRDGRPAGFLHFALVHAGRALSLSSMPRVRASTPNGFNEWLICEARRLGARARLPARLAQLLAVRGAARRRRCRAASAASSQRRALLATEGPLPARQPARVQPEVLPRAGSAASSSTSGDATCRGSGIAALAAEAYLPFQTAAAMTRRRARCWRSGRRWRSTGASSSSTAPPARCRRSPSRRPLRSLRLLFGHRRWLAGFVVGPRRLGALRRSAPPGAALARAGGRRPGGLGVLALLVWLAPGGEPLGRREQAAVGVALAGLAAARASRSPGRAGPRRPRPDARSPRWLAHSRSVAAAAVASTRIGVPAAAALGVCAGILYATGDVATKAAVAAPGCSSSRSCSRRTGSRSSRSSSRSSAAARS